MTVAAGTDLGLIIDAARDLAWRPTANMGGRTARRYRERYEAHERLVRLLVEIHVGPQGDPVLDCLIAAARRVAACTFSNRIGLPYYERRQAVAELRGCLAGFDAEVRRDA